MFEEELRKKEEEKQAIFEEMRESKARQGILEGQMAKMMGVLMQACTLLAPPGTASAPLPLPPCSLPRTCSCRTALTRPRTAKASTACSFGVASRVGPDGASLPSGMNSQGPPQTHFDGAPAVIRLIPHPPLSTAGVPLDWPVRHGHRPQWALADA